MKPAIVGLENGKRVLARYRPDFLADIIFDTQYLLYVSHNRFTFGNAAQNTNGVEDKLLVVVTNCPDGWSYTIWQDQDGKIPVSENFWLNTSLESANELRLFLNASNGASSHEAYIHVRAGGLVYIVTVLQNTTIPNPSVHS